MNTSARAIGRVTRHRRLRRKVQGMGERPRLAVFRSHKHLYVQLINDQESKTILGYSTKACLRDGALKSGGNVSAAELLGKLIAEAAVKQGISRVVFDRGGYRYHGRVKALAESARKAGLEF